MANSVTHFLSIPVYGARYNVPVAFRASDGTSLAPTSLDTEVSIDNGDFADATNEVVLAKEAGGATHSAFGYITLTETEMTAHCLAIQVKSANCVTAELFVTPRRIQSKIAGTATDGGNNTIVLQVGSAAPSPGMMLRINSGTGAGQARFVSSYDSESRTVTVERVWETNPSNDSVYIIGYLQGQFAGGMIKGIEGTKQTLDDLNDLDATDIADAVFDEAIGDHEEVGSFGAAINDAEPGDIADAVWDEVLSGHVAAGTFGAAVNDATAAAIADAVFDEVLSGHTDAGSFGAALSAATAGSLAQMLYHLWCRFLGYAAATEDVDGNAEMLVKATSGGATLRTIDFTNSGDVTTLEGS